VKTELIRDAVVLMRVIKMHLDKKNLCQLVDFNVGKAFHSINMVVLRYKIRLNGARIKVTKCVGNSEERL
jgi:hypothetical protein